MVAGGDECVGAELWDVTCAGVWSSSHESFLRHPCCIGTLLCSRAHAMIQAGGWQLAGICKTKVMEGIKLAAFN